MDASHNGSMDDLWYEEVTEEGYEPTVTEYNITSTPNDFNISTIFSLIDNGVIRMPPFQRNYVWDEKRASKLIESIILGLPVPQVFLYEQGKNAFYVIDGQQRLLSIYFFIKQRFPTKEGRVLLRQYLTGDIRIDSKILHDDKYFKNFALKLPSQTKEDKNKFDGAKYETIGDYKYTFDILRTIRSVVIKQNEPEDDSSIYEIFNRLNTGGQNLYPQEIRMSLYYSDFYRKLFEINELDRWRAVLNRAEADIHFKDVEILLRSFAMLFDLAKYSSPMSKFLNGFSKKANSFTDDTINYLYELFISFLDSCQELRSDVFITKSNQFSISLFESVFVATAKPFFDNKGIITSKIVPESIAELKTDSQFSDSNQGSVASKANVNKRMNRAKELLRFE